MSGGEGLLAGLRVVEVSSFVAAPLGGMTLAQLGAKVVRVDPDGGGPDIGRWPVTASGTSLYWTGLNKGKRSVTVDFRSPEGRARVTDLVVRAGVLLTNASGRGFLDDAALRERRPDLIHLQIRGRHDGRPAVDYTVNAATGFPLVTGPPEHSGPVNHVLPAWDVACGLYAALGIAAAERRRARTGEGCFLRVALEDVALATAGNLGFLAEAQFGVARERVGNHLYGSFARDFVCGDGGRVMVVALTSRHWRDLVALTGMTAAVAALEEGLGADFGREADRYAYREALAALFGRWFGERPLGEVCAALGSTSVLWEPYRSFTELVADPGLRENPLMSVVDQPGVGEYLAPGSPLSVDGTRSPASPAPRLGEHTEEVFGAGKDTR
ncbi:CoA transferase [Actinomadura sp. DC4]|uniref:CoA transferase n=1 Tax=Actinomadura sp. DC4 TaxID=3055069 RepID=UPI0025B086E0|nr:CoA transferase [Actinomadura sp. DC4]MDN3356289.1 CoA transferase [Actinomadura sp. DC4]